MSPDLLNKTKRMRRLLWAIPVLGLSSLATYYFWPVTAIPEGIVIDYIVVDKSQHRLQAFAKGQLIVSYGVAIGKHPVGTKECEGDLKTPEGVYTISGRNPYSGYHKNLGISYPNAADRARANRIGKPTGGDIKIHGLKNGHGYIGRFHRWIDWTNGCIALSNDEMDELYTHVKTGAIIEIKK